MQSKVKSVDDYILEAPEDRREHLIKLRETIRKNLPEGYSEEMGYGMAGYVVPHSLYPAGYHCNPEQPLPFMGFASQKNFVSFYHMGLYSDPELLDWFVKEYPKHSKTKLDMGKSCIRFKKPENMPLELLADLCRKLTPAQWIKLYEKQLKK